MKSTLFASRDILKALLPSGWAAALKVTAVYALVGLAWIFFSDRLLIFLFTDPVILTRLQTFKGLLFVVVTALLLFLVLWRYLRLLRRTEEQVFLVAQGISSEVGDAFFASLVAYLARVLETDCAIVAAYEGGEDERMRTVAVWHKGVIEDNFSFSLRGTPCKALNAQELCWCPRGVAGKLSADHPFRLMKVESCLAMSLQDARQNLLGSVMVLSSNSLNQRKTAEALLKIFAARAASEMERRAAEQKISHLAFFDTLTDLPNQQLFQEELEAALVHARRDNTQLALVYFDFDRFKTIVRSLGHRHGQGVLQQTAERLRQALHEGEILAHLGGDEFALCLPKIPSPQAAESMVERLLDTLKAPIKVVGHELYVTASVGVAVFPLDGDDAQTLLRNADVAMSRAKVMGRNNVQFYNAEMSRMSFQSMVLENRLHRALEREEFVLLYQPQLDLIENRLSGMEALVCWKQEGRAQFSPSEFIPLAEETGLIDPLGEWILYKACEQNRRWQDAGLPPQRVAVNISARQFYQRDIVALVSRVLQETTLDPRWLALEITESVLFQDIAETTVTLERLRDLGVDLIIDDFGTGYSSLSYLKNFPIRTLKIDQSFIAGIPDDAGSRTITSAVVAMAHHLNMAVIAEGVENPVQKEFLLQAGCDKIQGFLYSPPLRPEEFALQLKRSAATRSVQAS